MEYVILELSVASLSEAFTVITEYPGPVNSGNVTWRNKQHLSTQHSLFSNHAFSLSTYYTITSMPLKEIVIYM